MALRIARHKSMIMGIFLAEEMSSEAGGTGIGGIWRHEEQARAADTSKD